MIKVITFVFLANIASKMFYQKALLLVSALGNFFSECVTSFLLEYIYINI